MLALEIPASLSIAMMSHPSRCARWLSKEYGRRALRLQRGSSALSVRMDLKQVVIRHLQSQSASYRSATAAFGQLEEGSLDLGRQTQRDEAVTELI